MRWASLLFSAAEPHRFYAAPVPTLLYSRSEFLKVVKGLTFYFLLILCMENFKKAMKLFSLCHYLKTTHDGHHV
jgi:hypothetical protein